MTHASKKKGILLTKRNRLSFSFRRWPAIWLYHFAIWCLGTTHTSLDVALVSPFHPVAVSIMLKYKRPTNERQTNLYRTLTNFQKKTNPYGSPKYQMRTNTYMKRLTYFWHLNWGIQLFQCILEKPPSSMEWLLNPVNKGKYKRNVFVFYLLLSFFFSFGTFLGKALHRLANVGVK